MAFDQWKAERAKAKQQRSVARQQRDARQQYEGVVTAHRAWQEVRQDLVNKLEAVRFWRGFNDGQGFMLKKGEASYGTVEPVALVEVKQQRGQYVGGSSGVSVRIAKGVTYRTSGSRARYVPGPEKPTPVDEGRLLITDRRIAFAGVKQTREWAFDKLVSFSQAGDWIAVQVSNRQKTSGFGYSDDIAEVVEFRIELALATFNQTRPVLEQRYLSALAAHDRAQPMPPPPPNLPQAPWVPPGPPPVMPPPGLPGPIGPP